MKEFGFTVNKLFDGGSTDYSYGYQEDARAMFRQWSEHRITRLVYRFEPRIRQTTFVLNQATTSADQAPQYFGKVITCVPPLPINFNAVGADTAQIGREQMLMFSTAKVRSVFKPFRVSVRPRVVELRSFLYSSDGATADTTAWKPVPYGWQTNGQGYGTATTWTKTGWMYVWVDNSASNLGVYNMDQFWDCYLDVYITFRGRKLRLDSQSLL